MKRRETNWQVIALAMGFAVAVNAQTLQRRASINGGGPPDGGQCTVEVVVDGAAQVEIRGDNAVLRNLSGRAPQWRRFECTSVMPPNPRDFRFEGVDGRGRQQLTGDPGNGGPAIVRIDDPDNGSEGYTFRIHWGGGPGPITSRESAPVGPPERGDPDAFRAEREQQFRGDSWRKVLFQRVRADLDHVAADGRPFGGDKTRLVRTEMGLDDLQQKLARGFYDKRELDDVMGALDAVLRENRLREEDKRILVDDMDRMKDFRARHADYGAR